MNEEIQNKAVELTDEQAEKAAGGGQEPDSYAFICINCGKENTVLSDEDNIQQICRYCGYNNGTRKKSPYDGKP